ncbi:MAG: sigma-70 family RNA polymerase sigma factor [Balneolaceae bacterium]|nr:sigma-70 family RNA polymerase sigma factor [Balneolaceae bacterium]
MKNQKDITAILVEFGNGSQKAYQMLFDSVYDELKRIASKQLSKERENHTFSRTDLVHEAFLNMIDIHRIDWKNRAQFYGVAAICMKRLLIDYARKKLTKKRGGDIIKKTFIDELIPGTENAKEIVKLDEALQKLREFDNRMAEVVDYRYFGGLTIEQTSEVLNVSRNTVKRDWAKARGLLYKELKDL